MRRLSAAGLPSPETTRPSVQHSAPLAAAGSEVERCIPGSRISMRHVGADSLLHSKAAALGGPTGLEIHPLPGWRVRLQTLPAASLSAGSWLQPSQMDPVPAEGCPEQQPHNAVQSHVFLLHHVHGGQEAGSRSREAGCMLCRAIAVVGCEFFIAVAEPKKPLKMKILVCQEAFFHGVLTRVYFPAPPFPHCVVCVFVDAALVCAVGGMGAQLLQEPCGVAELQGGGVWVRGKAAENVKGAFPRLKPAVFDYGSSLTQRAERSN